MPWGELGNYAGELADAIKFCNATRPGGLKLWMEQHKPGTNKVVPK
jgi:hypothetical protein